MIAKLVEINLITMVYRSIGDIMEVISWSINQLISGGPHPASLNSILRTMGSN